MQVRARQSYATWPDTPPEWALHDRPHIYVQETPQWPPIPRTTPCTRSPMNCRVRPETSLPRHPLHSHRHHPALQRQTTDRLSLQASR